MPTYNAAPVNGLPANTRGKPSGKRVVLVTNPQVNSLEMVGPLYAFHEANFFLEKSGRDDLKYDLEVVSTTPGSMFSVRGLSIEVDRPYQQLRGPIDTIIFQGPEEDEGSLRNKKFIAWVKRTAKKARRVGSVCVGAYTLAAAGLLDGKRATTHWMASEELQRRFPKVNVDPDPIFIKDGNVYTSAGATAGLDMAVAMIEEDYGKSLARSVAQGLVMYMQRPGTQTQFSVHVRAQYPQEERIGAIQQYITENLDADLSVETLARKASMSPRNFSRVFAKELGMTPGRYVEIARLDIARQQLEQSDAPVSRIARHCGYNTADGLRLAFDRHVGVSPREYRRRFAGTGVGA